MTTDSPSFSVTEDDLIFLVQVLDDHYIVGMALLDRDDLSLDDKVGIAQDMRDMRTLALKFSLMSPAIAAAYTKHHQDFEQFVADHPPEIPSTPPLPLN